MIVGNIGVRQRAVSSGAFLREAIRTLIQIVALHIAHCRRDPGHRVPLHLHHHRLKEAHTAAPRPEAQARFLPEAPGPRCRGLVGRWSVN